MNKDEQNYLKLFQAAVGKTDILQRYFPNSMSPIEGAEMGWWLNPNLNLIDEVLSTLTEREHRVLRLRFGLRPETRSYLLKEVGQIFGVTQERIRQIEAKALRKLRHPSRLKRVINAMRETVK